MRKTRFILLVTSVLFFISIINVEATDYIGDGIHTFAKGDVLTLDNNWKLEVLGIFEAYNHAEIHFRLYDPEGNAYPSSPYENNLKSIDGEQKYGTSKVLNVKMQIIGVSGQVSPTASSLVSAYEKAEINAVSIDETLPSGMSENESPYEGVGRVEEINKKITLKDGKNVKLSKDEEILLGNSYKLKLAGFTSGGSTEGDPYFLLYDEKGNEIDSYISIGKGVGTNVGSYVQLTDFNENSVELTIVEGSKVIFGTGWNLFSIHVEDGDGYGTVLESTCNNATMWEWKNENRDYEEVGVLEEGARIPSGKGIWVKIQTISYTKSDMDCEILVSGKKSVTTKGLQLKTGWNSIGAPISAYLTNNQLTFYDIKGDCVIEKGPWQYIATPWIGGMFQNFAGDNDYTNKFSKPINNWLSLNKGYFIKVNSDCQLSDR